MVGGLLLSQALTLYTTPVIYIFFDNLAQRFSPKSQNQETSGAEAPNAPDADVPGPA
jgi:multidrug efflux pump